MYTDILLPTPDRPNPVAAVNLVQALIDVHTETKGGGTSFAIHVHKGKVYFSPYLPMLIPGVDDNAELDRLIAKAQSIVSRYYPLAKIDLSGTPTIQAGSHVCYLRFRGSLNHPLGGASRFLEVNELRGRDPLPLLCQIGATVREDEFFAFGLVMWGKQDEPPKPGFLYHLLKAAGPMILKDNYAAQRRIDRREEIIKDAIAHKYQRGVYEVIPYVCVASPDKDRATQIAESVANLFIGLSSDDNPVVSGLWVEHRFYPTKPEGYTHYPLQYVALEYKTRSEKRERRQKAWQDVFMMSPGEIATFWHLPDDTFPENIVAWLGQGGNRDLPPELQGLQEGVRVGDNHAADGSIHEVRLPFQERLMHTLLVGRTGMGKSALMHRMIHEDIEAGRGVVVIDPHGATEDGLVSAILRSSIPEHRMADVVLVDFSQIRTNPPSINPLLKLPVEGQDGDPENAGGYDALEGIADFADTLERIFPKDTEFEGSRMSDWLKTALLTAAVLDHPTLRDIRRVFYDKPWRDSLVSKSSEVSLVEDWDEIDRTPGADRTISGLLRRVKRFTGKNDTIVITCHPNPLHYGALAAQNKIILVSAGGGLAMRAGREERLALTSVIVRQVLDAAFAGSYKLPVMMYIDEAPSFVNAPIDDILREARKHRLGLVLASQGFSALSTKTVEAISETVSTFITFACSEHDAEVFEPFMRGGFTKQDLITLDQYTAAVSTMHQKQRMNPFLLHTLPQPEALDPDPVERIRSISLEKYMPMRYGEVLEAYKQRYLKLDASEAENEFDDDGESDHIQREN